MVQAEWPPISSSGEVSFRDTEWPLCRPADGLVSVALLEQGLVLSHAAVPRADAVIHHKKLTACGISCMITRMGYRDRGYGAMVFKAAGKFMETSGADLGIFTCDQALRHFYERAGWHAALDIYLVGGTKEKPFSSAEMGKLTLLRFFTDRAEEARADFTAGPMFLELGEGKLW
ncbi:MAG: hypothetical protein E4H36_01880 [Spirochaetales bacterium]|nr:MAG: hypothetical protein E4H36_01880 [Spirochaetales bacterium]